MLKNSALASEALHQPIVKGDLSFGVERRLNEAFTIARQRLVEQPSCRDLFEPFGKDGTAALAVTRYVPATLVQESRVCRHASAVTAVRSPVTWLCRSFARLPNEIAAQVLIHEALHYAGMTERPADPTGLDSATINSLVAKSCRRPRLTATKNTNSNQPSLSAYHQDELPVHERRRVRASAKISRSRM